MTLAGSNLWVVLLALRVAACSSLPVDLFGMCYAPVPLKAREEGTILDDDFMSENAKPLWGMRGRDDLSTIRNMGANAVRLYGNNPAKSHAAFLAYAHSKGLGVIPGMSDYPYTQMPGNCNATGFNCYRQVKEAYFGNLQNGFLLPDRTYHPALKHVIVINEPDMKIGVARDSEGEVFAPQHFARAVISAVDGMLDAEKEANVSGSLVNLTATVSFSDCTECRSINGQSGQEFALGQMLVLQQALLHPEEFGYQPKNNLTQFFWTRYLNSFNTQSDAATIRDAFLAKYPLLFPATPFFIEEFHSPDLVGSLGEDLQLLRSLSLWYSGSLFFGFSFFEFQKSFYKNQTGEERFGAFTLGEYQVTSVSLAHEEFPVWCLHGVPSVNVQTSFPHGNTIPEVIAEALGGRGVPAQVACTPNPEVVPLSQAGYDQICQLNDEGTMATFLTRVVLHLGGVVVFQEPLRDRAAEVCTRHPDFQGPGSVVADFLWMRDHSWDIAQQWIRWERHPVCVTDRFGADLSLVGSALEQKCKVVSMDCSNVPRECSNSTWDVADYVFSFYFTMRSFNHSVVPDLLADCYFDGAAQLLSTASLTDAQRRCVVTKDAESTPVTAEGWQAIIKQSDAKKTAIFVQRVVSEVLHDEVLDTEGLEEWAPYAWHVEDWDMLLAQLPGQPWVCGGSAWNRLCTTTPGPDAGPLAFFRGQEWLIKPLLALGGLVLLACVGTCLYVLMTPDPTQAWFDKQRDLRRARFVDDESSSSEGD